MRELSDMICTFQRLLPWLIRDWNRGKPEKVQGDLRKSFCNLKEESRGVFTEGQTGVLDQD